jgi:hypothetical protein
MLYVPVTAFILICIGWSIFWYVASSQTESLIDGWITREKSVGRDWTCPARQIGGYRAVSHVYQPSLALVEITGPFRMKAEDGSAEVLLDWEALQLSLRGLPNNLTRLSLVSEDMSLRGQVAGYGTFSADTGHAEAHLAPTAQRPDRAYDIYIALNDAVFPLLDEITGTKAKAAILLDGTMTQADFGLSGHLPERIERWRAAGGHVEFSNASLSKGTLNFKSKGRLGLDDERRLDGRLDTEFSGLEPVLAHYGVNPALLNAGAILNSLLGQRREAKPAEPKPFRLPLVIDQGQIVIGPLRLPIRLPPLY